MTDMMRLTRLCPKLINIFLIFLIFLSTLALFSTSLSAQGRFVLPTAKGRDALTWVSWGGLIAGGVLDAKASWDCPRRARCFVMQGIREGGTGLAIFGLKKFFHAARPCAPANCGSDDPYQDVPSGHLAFAMTTVNFGTDCTAGPKWQVQVPLAALTAYGRYGSWRHDMVGLLAGAALGSAANVLTRCR